MPLIISTWIMVTHFKECVERDKNNMNKLIAYIIENCECKFFLCRSSFIEIESYIFYNEFDCANQRRGGLCTKGIYTINV